MPKDYFKKSLTNPYVYAVLAVVAIALFPVAKDFATEYRIYKQQQAAYRPPVSIEKLREIAIKQSQAACNETSNRRPLDCSNLSLANESEGDWRQEGASWHFLAHAGYDRQEFWWQLHLDANGHTINGREFKKY